MGFKFTLLVAAGGLFAGVHEYNVGPGSLNTAPTANAGTDANAASAATVTLGGAASNANDAGQTLTYAWTQTGGTSVTLSDATAQSPTFTAPTLAVGDADEALTFSLVVNDGIEASSADAVTITVTAPSDTTPPDAPTAANTSITTNFDGSITVSGTDVESGATTSVTFPDGTIGAVAISSSGTYSVTSGPSQPTGNVGIVIVDAAGNASGILSQSFVAVPSVARIQTEIATYMQNRASLVIAAQPDLIGLLSGNVANAFNAQATQANGTFDFATARNQPVWARIQGSWTNSGDHKNNYFFGVAGAHVNLSPDAIAGVMLQFDRLSQKNSDSITEGNGYLVGPYFVAKSPDQPLYFEGRYLFGKTDNSVSIDGVAEQNFETDRNLLSMKVAGELSYGERWS
ncbi:PKD domain-containing protein [Yoonia sp. MH D7]